jgi:hypothetical protein
MATLNTEPNLESPDDATRQLISTHRGLDDAQSAMVNAKLILLLANHIGDAEVLAPRWPRRAPTWRRRLTALHSMTEAAMTITTRTTDATRHAAMAAPPTYQSGFGNEIRH